MGKVEGINLLLDLLINISCRDTYPVIPVIEVQEPRTSLQVLSSIWTICFRPNVSGHGNRNRDLTLTSPILPLPNLFLAAKYADRALPTHWPSTLDQSGEIE